MGKRKLSDSDEMAFFRPSGFADHAKKPFCRGVKCERFPILRQRRRHADTSTLRRWQRSASGIASVQDAENGTRPTVSLLHD